MTTAELDIFGSGRSAHRSLPEATVALRKFVGDDGQEWQVWETRPTMGSPNVKPSAADAFGDVPRISKKREGGWLTFTAAADRRRLSPIPDDWETADEPSLRAMLDAADRIDQAG